MNQANISFLPEDDRATSAVVEETIHLPSLVAPTWVAVGNVLVALIAVAITYFTEPFFRNGYWFKMAAATYFFVSLGLLITHLLGTGSRGLRFSRTIRAENDCIRVMEPGGCSYVRLQDCYWHEAVSFCNVVWLYWRGKSCLLLREKDTYNTINCGMTQETKSAWVTFLQKEGIPEGRPLTHLQRCWTIVGVVLGLYLAYNLTAFVGDLNLGRRPTQAITVYCWGTLTLLGGFLGAVLTGNDWFHFSRKKALILMFYLFSFIGCLSLIPVIGILGSWYALLDLALGSVNGVVGIGMGFCLSYLGEKRRQAYLSRKMSV